MVGEEVRCQLRLRIWEKADQARLADGSRWRHGERHNFGGNDMTKRQEGLAGREGASKQSVPFTIYVWSRNICNKRHGSLSGVGEQF